MVDKQNEELEYEITRKPSELFSYANGSGSQLQNV